MGPQILMVNPPDLSLDEVVALAGKVDLWHVGSPDTKYPSFSGGFGRLGLRLDKHKTVKYPFKPPITYSIFMYYNSVTITFEAHEESNRRFCFKSHDAFNNQLLASFQGNPEQDSSYEPLVRLYDSLSQLCKKKKINMANGKLFLGDVPTDRRGEGIAYARKYL